MRLATVRLDPLDGTEAPRTVDAWSRFSGLFGLLFRVFLIYGGSGPLMQDAHGVKEKKQGSKSTFRRTLRIFLEDGGRRRVQWELERQTTEEAPEKCVAARPLTTVARIPMQVKHDGRLLCWVPRAQSQAQQGSSVQGTDVMKRDVGVQTEKDEIVVLGDVRGAELAGMGETATTKVGESMPRGASCKGKAKNEALDNTNVTLRDPSSSGVIKGLEPEMDSSSSEEEEGEFLDEASIIYFFDKEEGLLIEQLEKEYEEQERDQKRRLDDGLKGVASLLEMGEGDIMAPFSHKACGDGEVALCKDKGTEHFSVNLLSNEVQTIPLLDTAQKQISSSDIAYPKTNDQQEHLNKEKTYEPSNDIIWRRISELVMFSSGEKMMVPSPWQIAPMLRSPTKLIFGTMQHSHLIQ
ncbi:uncharacterized protein G2W53_014073 [Senna tora]|uniref:Uncharacterized protein n=1 Tax=Senna tora TaxID=362788 RepID=A0A834WPZ3_9FABA|nr:uncharacterized protein G2W53_014073 [Senna tora]